MPEVHRPATGNRRYAKRHRLPRLCLLIWSNGPDAGRLRDISAMGSFIETDARPSIGDLVMLEHPDAGCIEARVNRIAHDGIGLVFDGEAHGLRFAMAAIAQDMAKQRHDLGCRHVS